MIKQYLETGKIVGTHGIMGMVRVQPWSDSGEFLTNFKRFFLSSKGDTELQVLKVQPHGGVVLISFKGVDSVDRAEALCAVKPFIFAVTIFHCPRADILSTTLSAVGSLTPTAEINTA